MQNGNLKFKIIFIFVIFLAVLFLPKISWAQSPIDNLQPGQWYEVPNSKIRNVLPSPIPPGGTGPESIIIAWNSGAYDTTRDRYIITGGGHNDYGGNELYAFSINTLTWSRAWGPSVNIPATQGSCNETYSDGAPASRHTYDGLEYMPNVDRFWVHGGSLYCGGGNASMATWEFNFNNSTWSRRANSYQVGELEEVSAYDSVTGHIFAAGPASSQELSEYNPVTNTWTVRGDSVNYGQTAEIDPKRRKFVSIGNGNAYIFDLNQASPTRQALNSTGDTAMVNASYPGLAYDPVSDRIIGWNGGSSVFSLNLDTRVWTKINPSASNTVIPTNPPSQGNFNRWRYVPSKNVFIVVNSIDQNVYIYKLSSGTPPTDTTPPTVSITAPASGSTVSGSSITVSANASDPSSPSGQVTSGVAGVQFKLDGVNLGTEDTTSLYSITWNTTQTTNGSHTLTATARDAAGNQVTSSGVTVTVNNAATDTQVPTIPTNLSATAVSSSQINLSWTASSDNVGVAGYRIYRCQGSGCTPSIQISTSGINSYSDSGLSPSTTYIYRVAAYDAAGNVSGQSVSASATTQASPPTGQINITPGIFYGLTGPNIGSGISSNSNKHTTWAHNPLDGRLYSMGGDFTSQYSYADSYEQEQYSLSIYDRWTNQSNNNAGWRLEYPYCGPSGGIQPKSPDFTGWSWDSTRNVFWSYPGTFVIPVYASCSDRSASATDDPKYKFRHIMKYNPAEPDSTKRWTDWDSNGGPQRGEPWMGFYDPVTDTITRFAGDSSETADIYNVQTKTWSSVGYGPNAAGGTVRIPEQVSPDFESRVAYIIDGTAGRLMRWNMNTRTLSDLGTIPDGPITPITNAYSVWDSVNKVLIFFHYNTGRLHVYRPATATWETPPQSTSPAGLTPHVRHAMVFDPNQNVVAFLGNTSNDNNIYLYRYANAGTPPPTDTQAPTAPTNLSATAVSSSQINLSWTASSDNVGVAGYRIYRGGTQIGTSATNSYSNTGLSPNTTYSYTVSAYDAAGNNSNQSLQVSAMTQASTGGRIINATPSNYESLLTTLVPGDTLILSAGNYYGMPVYNLNGTASQQITITGPTSGSGAVILGSSGENTLRIDGSSYVTIKNLEINSRNLGGDPVNGQGVSHHITLDNLYIHGFSDDQGTVGISTNRAPTWNWTIKNNTITDGGTGMYLGNSDGNEQFLSGVIENNLIYDTIGYNIEIKHQNSLPTNISGLPLTTTKTIIRNNVFSKANNASTGGMARPNLLVGHVPLFGSGTNNYYEIYGNFFYQNPTGEPLFQGEGNVAFYNNLLFNSVDPAGSYAAITVQPHNDVPKNIRVFNNTVVTQQRGISVSGGSTSYQQKVIGNAVFAATPISASDQASNIIGTYAGASNYLTNPFGGLGTKDFYPRVGMLTGAAIDTSSFNTYSDWNKDFNAAQRTNFTFRGAYFGEGANPGWLPKLQIKPLSSGTPSDATPPLAPTGVAVQ